MSFITQLRAELDSDPGRYSTMSNVEVVVSINDESVPQTKASITGAEMWAASDAAELTALSDAQLTKWMQVCAITNHDPRNGRAVVAIVQSIFTGGSSPTVVNLVALRSFSVSRARQLGFKVVKEGHVEMARAL